MRYILTVVEQLDRAARELTVNHPINNRLALIWILNAVELIIHLASRCTLIGIEIGHFHPPPILAASAKSYPSS